MTARVRTWRLVVAYDGAGFAGWQRQDGQRTVQGDLEQVLSAIERAPVHVAGGRTHRCRRACGGAGCERAPRGRDRARAPGAGVQQQPRSRRARARGRRGLRSVPRPVTGARQDLSLLHLERAVRSASAAPHVVARAAAPGARGDAGGGRHVRRQPRLRGVPGAGERRADHRAPHVDGDGRAVPDACPTGATASTDRDRLLCFEVSGEGFLRHMVRIMAGTLVWAGRGRFTPALVQQALAGGSRNSTGPTAPAHGLHLWRVHYDGDDGRWGGP